jgi:riboflavin kinase/FMN adenylyltransferase
MKVFNRMSIEAIPNPVVTIGIFDGVHAGHRIVLDRLNQAAREKGGESVLLTLWPHPRLVLGKVDHDFKLLNTLPEKQLLLEGLGIDNLVIMPFTKQFAQLTAREFIQQYLVKEIGVHHLVVGFNHHFGKNRDGNYENLLNISKEFDFTLEKMEEKKETGTIVSSTKIRNLLHEGKIREANKMLGYPFFVTGNIVSGNRIGRQIGFPTANIEIGHPYKQLPRDGVYAVHGLVDGELYPGMMNIGVRPTIEESKKEKRLEVHFFDFDASIYQKDITIVCMQRIRDEKKFDGLDQLTAQLKEDKIAATKVLQTEKMDLALFRSGMQFF